MKFTIDAPYTETITEQVPNLDPDAEPEFRTYPNDEIRVTYTNGQITRKRSVKVCKNALGQYDHGATLERCESVGRTIAEKIRTGRIRSA